MEMGKGADVKVEDVTCVQRGQDSWSVLAGTRGASCPSVTAWLGFRRTFALITGLKRAACLYGAFWMGAGDPWRAAGRPLNSNYAAVKHMTQTCLVLAFKRVKQQFVINKHICR